MQLNISTDYAIRIILYLANRKQVKQLDTLKTNVDKILNVSGQGREPEQEKRPTVDL